MKLPKSRHDRFAAALVLLILTGCGGRAAPAPAAPAPPPPAPAPPPALTEGEIRAVAELLLFEDRRTLDAPRIRELLGHWSEEVRSRAALAAGRIRDPAATPLLLEALNDSSARVVADAVFALGESGDTSAAVIRTLATHARGSDSVAIEAVASLGRLASRDAFAELTDLLSAPDPLPAPVLQEALLVLPRFRQAPLIAARIAPHLRDPDPEVRWRAAYALSRPGSATAVSLLLPCANDTDARVRAQVVRALRAPLADSAGQREAAKSALLAALDDDDPHVRINALGALATYEDAALAPGIAARLDDPDANVRVAAAQALGTTGGGTAELERVVADTLQKFGVRATALLALARTDAERGAAQAEAWAGSHRWLARLYAARALANVPWSLARAGLRVLARDGDGRVADAAFDAIAALADSTSEAYALYVQGLRAPDPRARAAAIAGIGRRGGPESFAMLMDAYDQAQGDSLPAARLAAANALARLSRTGVPVANAFFTRFPPPDDAAVRARIERQLGGAWPGPPPPPPEPRGLAFYEDVVRRLVAPAVAGKPAPRLRIVTEEGAIIIELAAGDAPLTVDNIMQLVRTGWFAASDDADAWRWHRVVPNFVLQDGDPNGDGRGPGYSIRDEINRRRYGRGALGMALSGPDTGGSQFFITHSPQPHLDGGYTIFGQVVSGMDVADRVVLDDRISRLEILEP